ncbi:MAG: hypothetical protein ACSLFP_05390 [Acidimicrobiales bacterium]
MSSPRPRAALALAVWTFFVWTTRINNIVGDEALDSGQKVARVALALSFTALVALVLVALASRPAWLRPAVTALAVWTVAVWAVRAVAIGLGDHEAGFIAVHLALAVVSVVLAGLAVRELRPTPAPT